MEDHGPLRLFISEGVPWPYYARPAGGDITADDVRAMRRRQWELGIPETFEWIVDLAPTLSPAAREAGLDVDELPLMALDRPLEAPAVDARLRRLEPDDPALAPSRAVADIAFGAPGTARGEAGPSERDAAIANFPEARLAAVRARMAAGLTVTIVAEDDDGVLAVGSHQPVGGRHRGRRRRDAAVRPPARARRGGDRRARRRRAPRRRRDRVPVGRQRGRRAHVRPARVRTRRHGRARPAARVKLSA